MKKLNFNKHERAILQTLHIERRPMTIKELAEETDISWVTIKNYLRKLEQRKYIIRRISKKTEKDIKENTNKRIAWAINYKSLEE